MLVKMLVGLSGPAYSLAPGDERDFPQEEALRLIAAEYATPVAGKTIERAVVAPAPEKRGKRGKNVVHAENNGGAGQ